MTHHKIDYCEFAAGDLEATESFFETLLNWKFTHYGEDYIDCNDGGLMVGFYRAPLASTQDNGGAMLTFYSDGLNASQTAVEKAGGKLTKEIFSFPGGRRFQFLEPSGNEFSFWTKDI